MAKTFFGVEKVKGIKSALFYNTGSGDRVISIPIKQLRKALKK